MYAVYEERQKLKAQKSAYLLIMNMNHTSVKNTEIKVRISKQDKTRLQELARKQNMTLSNYILTRCFTDTELYIQMIPDAVETWNAYNKILHAVKTTDDKLLMMTVENIINHALQKTQFSKGEMNNEQTY